MGAGMDRRCPRMQARFDKRAGGRILSSGTPEPSTRSLTAVVTEARPSREMSQPFHSALTFPRRWKMSTPWPYIHACKAAIAPFLCARGVSTNVALDIIPSIPWFTSTRKSISPSGVYLEFLWIRRIPAQSGRRLNKLSIPTPCTRRTPPRVINFTGEFKSDRSRKKFTVTQYINT